MARKPWLYGLVGLALLQIVPIRGMLYGIERDLTVVYDRAVKGFVHPESVAYDPGKKVLYAGQFGSVLKPTLKDGKGKISRLTLKGQVLADPCLPPAGSVMDKPKGIWIEGERLWVTDIDSVWLFDLATLKGKKVTLPGAKFANDPAVAGGVLLVSDTGGARIYEVRPADWLAGGTPQVAVRMDHLPFSPNGLFPAGGGSLLVVGYDMGGKDEGIYSLEPSGRLKVLAEGLGRLDGVFRMEDGRVLITDWKSGALAQWSKAGGFKTLAGGFSGPADFCVLPDSGGYLVVVPDLVKSEIRFIGLK